MKLRSAALVLPVALVAAAFAPATADSCTTIDDPRFAEPELTLELCEETAFFTSSNPAKVDNLSSIGASDFPTWAADEPASVTTGSGAGFVGQFETSLLTGPDSISGVTYEGTFDGALTAIAVEQYIFTAAEDVNGAYGIVLTANLNGRTVYESDFIEGDAAPIEAGGDAVKVFRFALTDLLFEGLAFEGEQELSFNITPYFIGDDGVFVYGASEAPSSITFNPSDLGGFAKISANNG